MSYPRTPNNENTQIIRPTCLFRWYFEGVEDKSSLNVNGFVLQQWWEDVNSLTGGEWKEIFINPINKDQK